MRQEQARFNGLQQKFIAEAKNKGVKYMTRTFQKQSFLVLLAIGLASNLTHAQSCNPAVVSYVVRDERGKRLDEATTKAVYERLPKAVGDAKTWLGEISFAADAKTYYWHESVDWSKGKKVPALEFINNETCTLRLPEATLVYRNKTMRLIFNLEINHTQHDRRLVIDSQPFQEGTFALDMRGWISHPNKMIPAHRWKRVKDQRSR